MPGDFVVVDAKRLGALQRGRSDHLEGMETGLAQQLKAAAGNLFKWVLHRGNHPRDTGFDQRRRTRRCLAGMRTGFQCDVAAGPSRGYSRGLAILQRFDFGMGAAEAAMESLADDPIPLG